MQEDIARQQALGLDVRWLEPEEVVELVPILDRERIFGASFCPTDGHVNPFRLVTGFYQAARRKGLRVLTGCEVQAIRQTDAGDAIVEFGDQAARAPTVLIAAGPGSRKLCLDLGFDLPLANMCYESMITEALPPLFEQMFGVATGDLFFRQTRHGGVHFGGGTIQERDDENTTEKNLQLAIEHLVRLVPALRDVNLLRTWGGVDPSTPDGEPIIDRLNENVFVATGFCGHGLALGPAVGLHLAEWIASGEKPQVFEPFGYRRFEGLLLTRWTPTGSFEAAIVSESSFTPAQRGGAAGGPMARLEATAEQVDLDSWRLVINPEVCTGCRMCESACVLRNDQVIRPTNLRVQIVYPSDDFYMPLTCIHCEDAPCLESCPVDALVFDEHGIVQVIDEDCVGCLICVYECPYGGITYVEELGTVIKCDLCGGNPACAVYCPTQAISFAPLDEDTWEKMAATAAENVRFWQGGT